ncbi:MAG: DoxX family protein [Dehalococcoidia bacterium]|nr:DoxX family protein [Dehalococcoidia bacterium]
MRSLGLLLLRLVAGGTLAAHGYPKLFGGAGKRAPEVLTAAFGPNFPRAVERGGPRNTGAFFESIGIPQPYVGAYLAGLGEFFGGLAIVLGLKTRLAAAVAIFDLAVAIKYVHWRTGFYGEGGYEFPAALSGAFGALALTGPGVISLDALTGLKKRRRARRTPDVEETEEGG